MQCVNERKKSRFMSRYFLAKKWVGRLLTNCYGGRAKQGHFQKGRREPSSNRDIIT